MDSSFLKYLVLAALIAAAVFAVWKTIMKRKNKTAEQDLADEIEIKADGAGSEEEEAYTDEDTEEAYTDEDTEESYTDEESD